MEWYEKSAELILKDLSSSRNGLSQSDAEKRLEQFGYNVLPEKKKTTDLMLFLDQFKNFLVIILIIAAFVSFAVGESLDAAAIIAIVILNAIFGFFQERKAEKALEALKKFAAPTSKVLRNGAIRIINSSEVVPGDILLIESGDKVPADCRIIEESNLKADESILTGESTTIRKTSDAMKGRLGISDQKNMLFSGTTIAYGRCRAIAVATGARTEFGKIAEVLQEEEEPTPLQKKMETLGKQLGIIIIAISVVVFFAGLFHDIEIVQIFLTSISLAVAAIPEGLPAVITITLAIGLLRMARKNAIIRKLPAVETLGSTTIVCADKTGTLTKNEMTVKKLYVDGKILDVTGEGYDPDGEILFNDKKEKSEDIELLLTTGMLCNNAIFDKEKKTLIGDPTELALLVSAMKYGIDDARPKHKRLKEIEFDSSRKMMSVVYKIGGRSVMYAKGAVEEIMKKCTKIYENGILHTLTEDKKRNIISANEKFAKGALRVLAFAIKRLKEGEVPKEDDMIFIGLQAMIDPPRPEVKPSVELCSQAGIRVVMITGDHKDTAVAIGEEIGLHTNRVITGAELDDMKDEEFEAAVDNISVYARVSPEHKVRITDALKKKGHIVAMTGDGINDAPALKKADIGIAVGSGTDVAKEASDMVLADNNFASVVSAVEEGRGIYDNIKKFIRYLLSCNIGEVAVVFLALVLALPLPLLPLQLLWMNLVTDGLPALALGAEPYEPGIMKRKPRNPKEKVLDRHSMEFIIFVGAAVALITLFIFYSELPNVEKARTMAFTSLVMIEMAVALSFRPPQYLFNMKSDNKLLLAVLSSVILQLIILYTPFFNVIFDTVPLMLEDWIKIFAAASVIFVAIELKKVLYTKQNKF